MSFLEDLKVLVESQGGEEFVALALAEFGFEFADDVPPGYAQVWVVRRAQALFEEAQ
jgi:hypothetical protein